MASKKSTSTTSSTTRGDGASSRARVTKPAPAPPKPRHSPGSLARRKADLLAVVREHDTGHPRRAEAEAELAKEPLASTPIYSPEELRRLGE